MLLSGAVAEFTCQECGRDFAIPEATLAKYPNWAPKRCLRCKNQAGTEPAGRARRTAPGKPGGGAAARGGSARARSTSTPREENLTTAEVLQKYTGGPTEGVFTDGAAEPNPGPGGWGAVYVVRNEVAAERWGHEPHTTNNRMELTALIAGCELVPVGTPAVVFSDSELCVKTINEWAKGWKARGWKRKSGAIKNLDLVQRLYAIFEERPELELRWIAAHSGNRWNEYADALATAYRRTQR